ncbi:hypothetical protein BK004_02580 [bacterium CG10_46_32]|nr:MAG: hypothetical protein BK004_02580 [bacterium CG10_46_32]PIR56087.1 MAG: hypothetical protein COU73_02605 [Parcubacteria group bacterium CG10_big_fil_rev_8_21_14_0_10_46_32]
MKILLTGGGTLGSASPLFAVYEEAKKQHKNWEWFWVGTKNGVEKHFIESLGLNYEWIPSVKLRRYFSLHILIDPFFFIAAFLRSLLIIMTIKPDVVVGAGSFVSVPVSWAAKLFGKKIIIHQQDIRPTLSNKMVAPIANKITVSFKKSLDDFSKKKTQWIGNPVRDEVLRGESNRAKKKFEINSSLPTILVTGGSSGSEAINTWVWQYLKSLCEGANLIHLTGLGKSDPAHAHVHYHQLEFLEKEMPDVLALADIVVSRAGISIITEFSALQKTVILIPMPHTHQENNAFYCANEHASFAYRQDQLDERVVRRIHELLHSPDERKKLSSAMGMLMKQGGAREMVHIIESLKSK